MIFAMVVAGIFIFSKSTMAAPAGSVVINEITWMGSAASANHEWLELKNNSEMEINLSGWRLIAQDGTPNIILSGVIAANGFFLLERTSDQTVPDVTADQIYTGALGDGGEDLFLYDAEDNLIDQVLGGVGWLAGDKINKLTMERIDATLPADADNWQNSAAPGGTPRQVNSEPEIIFDPPLARIIGPTQALVNEVVYFDGRSSSAASAIIDYLWDFGDGQTGRGATTSYAYVSLGVFTVSLTVVDDQELTASEILIVTVSEGASIEPPAAIDYGVVINEFLPAPASGDKEWVELFNFTTSTIDLTGWQIVDGSGAITNLSGEISAHDFRLIWEPKGNLNNAGDLIVLKNNLDAVVDQVAYGNWDDGDLSDNAPLAGKGESVARRVNGQDTNVDAVDFVLTLSPTPGAGNLITLPPVKTAPNPPSAGGSVSSAKTFQPSDVVINEFLPDPAAGDKEWVELFNNTAAAINLTGWQIVDGSGALNNLTGQIGSRQFLVVWEPKGKLNNNGDIIFLKDLSGRLIDQVTYGGWDDNNLTDNAPLAGKGESVARKFDGVDTNNDGADFAISQTPTPGAANIFISPAEKTIISGFDQIIINEIFPNPVGSDLLDEFIELYNQGDETVDLAGWFLADAGSRKYKINAAHSSSTMIEAKGFFVVRREISGIALNNSGLEMVRLYAPDLTLIDWVEYQGPVAEGQTYGRARDNIWFWTNQDTPGQANIFSETIWAPTAIISVSPEQPAAGEIIFFDASDSFDPAGESLNFYWDLGNGKIINAITVDYQYERAGVYRVNLKAVNQSGRESSAEKIIYVGVDPTTEPLVWLSEVLPNPKGRDEEKEFIEIYNPQDWPINLAGWRLERRTGASRYVFGSTVVPAKSYLAIFRPTTKLALNNQGDQVKLFDATGQLISQVEYQTAKEGLAYAFDPNGYWRWTSRPTPGQANYFMAAASGQTGALAAPVDLRDLADYEIGDWVKVSGLVAVEPGVLGTQIFYLVGEEGGGIQVYCFKKDFPPLRLGDAIEVTGEIAASGGERRIKITGREQIKLLNQNYRPMPQILTISELEPELVGSLVKISGLLIEKSGNNLFLDDNLEEIKVYLKSSAGISLKDLVLKEGDQLIVTGILSTSQGNLRLLPRYQDDLVRLGQVRGEIEELASGNVILESRLFKYLIALVVFMSAVIGWLVFRKLKIKIN